MDNPRTFIKKLVSVDEGVRCVLFLDKIKKFYEFGGSSFVGYKVLDKILGSNKSKEYIYEVCNSMDPAEYPEMLSKSFEYRLGRKINLEQPKTFTEKIQWMKLHESTPIKTKLADKYLVRDWVKRELGEEYLIPLLGVWNRFDEVNFDVLPKRFVLKCNHGSGMNEIILDKNNMDISEISKKFNAWMNINYAHIHGTFEMQYEKIPPKIIAEKYMDELGDFGLIDYKIHCFHGEPMFIQCIGNRDLSNHLGFQMNFDTMWNQLDWTFETYPAYDFVLPKPAELNEMICIARILSKSFSYVRVDLYDLNGKIVFGEMTFTPADGLYKYKNKFTYEKDLELGQMIHLPVDEM